MGDPIVGRDDRPRDAPPSSDGSRRPHDATLRFEYESPARARAVARAVAQEVGEIDGDRSAATVERDAESVVVRVVADDLVALRAGCNTWGSLVEVAERTSGLA
ncbi:KEOPS complex subunit Pcc1 [Halorussus aquaticus]|uniref:KEOPS complex subunit Pcc1 n=1 Tax=Halorussus aquaticus TaxID=2953748 RepID=A0ABD5Q2E1_9EURY